MTRNVLNIADVDTYLRPFQSGPYPEAVARWFARSVRRWIIRTFEPAGRIVRITGERDDGADDGADDGVMVWLDVRWPDGRITNEAYAFAPWLAGALADGVYVLDLDGPEARSLMRELRQLAGFLTRRGRHDAWRLERITVADALRMAADARARAQDMADATASEVLRFDDGFRFVVLDRREEFHREGRIMRHCAAEYYGNMPAGCELVSLRDARDRPHATLEIVNGARVVQVQGRANGPVAPRYHGYIAAFVHALGLRVEADRQNTGILYRTFEHSDPHSWWGQEDLRRALAAPIIGNDHISPGFAEFEADVRIAVNIVGDEALEELIDLHRTEIGGFLRCHIVRAYRIHGLRVFAARIVVPDWLIGALATANCSRRRALRRVIIDQLAGEVYGFLQSAPNVLVHLDGFEALLPLDYSGLRHQRRQSLLRRVAGARRQIQSAQRTGVDDETLQDWEADRRALLDEIQQYGSCYV